MHERPSRPSPSVLFQLPSGPRIRRERLLEIARHAIPLLQLATETRNASLVQNVFAALGDIAAGCDGTTRLAAIVVADANVVPLRTRAARGDP